MKIFMDIKKYKEINRITTVQLIYYVNKRLIIIELQIYVLHRYMNIPLVILNITNSYK